MLATMAKAADDFAAAVERLRVDFGPAVAAVEAARLGLLGMVGEGLRVCHHPDAVQEYQWQRGGWRRVRAGRGWRLRRGRPGGVFVKRCPDCPAWAWQLDNGMAVHLALPLTLVACEEER
jgi:hypothetical protein